MVKTLVTVFQLGHGFVVAKEYNLVYIYALFGKKKNGV